MFASWSSEKSRTWRRLRELPEAPGTAVTVQRMVFGNAGGTSGAGVGFTRHPSTGEPAPWVDFLFDAQGEDVVSGRRSAPGHQALAAVLPRVWTELVAAADRLERGLGDMQDFEFTVEEGHLFLLQARTGQRTPEAAARIALDLFDEGVLDREQALARTQGLDANRLARVQLAAAEGDAPAILVRAQAETADIAALDQAAGLLTQRGARTSHAAVVARQMGKVCLVGCEDLRIDLAARTVRIAGRELRENECITLDGNSGAIHAGRMRTVRIAPVDLLRRLQSLRSVRAGPHERPAPDRLPANEPRRSRASPGSARPGAHPRRAGDAGR